MSNIHLGPFEDDLQGEVRPLPVAVGEHGVEQDPQAAGVAPDPRRVAPAPLVVDGG